MQQSLLLLSDPPLGLARFLFHSWHSRAPLSGSAHDFTIYRVPVAHAEVM